MSHFLLRVAKFFVLVTIAVVVDVNASGATELTDQLSELLDQHSIARRTTVALKVIDVESGAVLYDRGGDRLLTPASNLKIYTSACALDKFGPSHQFETRVKVAGTLRDGVLEGDLVLVGSGDAMLNSEDLGKIADRVAQELGIKEIRGEVVVDNSRYASPLKGPGWMWDDDPEYYNMSISPLMLDFNVLEVALTPGEEEAIQAKLLLPTSYPSIKFVSRKSLGQDIWVTRRPFTHPLVVAKKGKLDNPETQRITMLSPGRWIEGVFTAMLAERGVQFTSAKQIVSSLNSDSPELVHRGQALTATLKHFNHKSENAVGEVLLHEIAITNGVKKPKWADGAKSITTWLVDTAGLDKDSFRLVDGSGLSRYNLISADSSVRLLAYMHKHRHAQTFYEALKPYELEIDGNIQKDLVVAKPGGMGGVSTISGYLTTLRGRKLAFSLLANGYIGSAEPVFGLRNEVWEVLAQYERGE